MSEPLSAALALGQVPLLKEPRIIGDWVFWLEQRPNECGRTTALIRPWARPDFLCQELTPSPINLRTRVHEYGGAPVAIAASGNQMTMAWIDGSDGCLWTQSFEGLSWPDSDNQPCLIPFDSPKCLSCQGEGDLADGLIDLPRQRWIGVMERDGQDFLIAFSLKESNQSPEILYRPSDFIGYCTLSPNGKKLAWLEWQQPAMPWDSSQLLLARFAKDGSLSSREVIAGSRSGENFSISVVQPFWLSSGELVVAEDSTGWWNLMLMVPEIVVGSSQWLHLWPMKTEAAMPQWVYGMSSNSGDGKQIISASCDQGIWKLDLLTSDGEVRKIDQPFNDLEGIDAKNGRVVAIASNPLKASGLLEIDIQENSWIHTPSVDHFLEEDQISIPEAFWFQGWNDEPTHSWYYPPMNGSKIPAPLLVKSHSGPTSMASTGLNLGIQFWTSRGWGVVDVNYGGSTGFGREYRERLKGGWGEVDVFDCAAVAKALVAAGKAHKERIAIEGSSAGGFTTLACLCFTDIFRVGACRYAVSDLNAMAQETHRFEAGYLDYLLGKLPNNLQIYNKRSPLINADKIQCPVIFFQGLKDKVVPPQQTQRMVEALKKNNIPVEIYTFMNEGHGFRDSKVKVKVLEATEIFFRKYLQL